MELDSATEEEEEAGSFVGGTECKGVKWTNDIFNSPNDYFADLIVRVIEIVFVFGLPLITYTPFSGTFILNVSLKYLMRIINLLKSL